MEEIRINFKDGIIEEGYLWVFDNFLQAICRIDLRTKVLDVVAQYEGKKDYESMWMLKHEKKLYLISMKTPHFLIYDMQSQSFKEEFDFQINSKVPVKLSAVFIYGENLWMVPRNSCDDTYCFDLRTNLVTVKKDISESARTRSVNSILSPYVFREGKYLWFPVFETSDYIRFDLEKEKAKYYSISEDKRICGICKGLAGKWITCTDEDTLIHIGENGQEKYVGDSIRERGSFSRVLELEDKIICLPRYRNELQVIDKQTFACTRIWFDKETSDEYIERVRNYCCEQSSIYLFPFEGKKLYKFDCVSQELTEESIFAEFDYKQRALNRKLNTDKKVMESNNLGLTDFLNFL